MMKPLINDGSVELLKWIGLILMTFDHVNTFILNGKYPFLFETGRVVMPLFAFVLAYNLARPKLSAGAHKRMMKRLLICGLIAEPIVFTLKANAGYGEFPLIPLNIMFTLITSVICIFFLEKGENEGGVTSYLLFVIALVIGGGLSEYFHPAILFTIFSWQYCKSGKKGWLLLMLLMMFPIGIINTSMSGAFSLLIIFAVAKLNISIPRAKNFFYAFYPSHLAVLFLVGFLINSR